ncbi:hypothetical protein LR010_01965, partial [Candidatus Gracilibacteria bacterium]|nr:hypothetical protein [Candidatus Gracilibacteria bacterium]
SCKKCSMSLNELKTYWEALLSLEGLSVIDAEAGYNSREKDILSPQEKIEILKKKGYEVEINQSEGSICLLRKGVELGRIKTGNYTYNGVHGGSHLEKEISPCIRGQGIGQTLYDIYKGLGFIVPKHEYSHSRSAIMFLLRNDYYISSIMSGNKETECCDAKIDTLLENASDDNIGVTLKLSLRK